MTRSLTVQLDECQWAWLRDHGELASALLALLDRAIRQDVLKRALRDEHHVELLIRRRAKLIRARFDRAREDDDTVTARALAEEETLRWCATVEDPALRAGGARLRLRLQIDRGEAEDVTAAKAALQLMREQRPGLWRELLTERPS